MRVVVDTNVYISALTSSTGSNRKVLRACLADEVQPLMGITLFHEYESLATRPEILARCPLSAPDRDRLLDAFLSRCDWVSIYFLWRPNLRDEGDNHLIELAVAGGAAAIVTNNTRDLKSGELAFPALKILKPAELLGMLP
jgi:putative PIN family toxin of toxin-antitoxin system